MPKSIHYETDYEALERVTTERDALADRLKTIAALLEEAVCTEGCDKGVILLSDHGTTHREEGVSCPIYDHEYFSPLGDALIAAWELSKR